MVGASAHEERPALAKSGPRSWTSG